MKHFSFQEAERISTYAWGEKPKEKEHSTCNVPCAKKHYQCNNLRRNNSDSKVKSVFKFVKIKDKDKLYEQILIKHSNNYHDFS